MKKISQEQINSILKLLVDLNIPVQSFNGVSNLFAQLPPVEEKKEKKD